MPLTPEQKSEHLLRNGYDPTKFELDDDGTTVYEREDQPAFTPSVVAVPQAPPKMSAMEAVKVTAPRAILPTIGGFAGAAALGALAGGPVGAIALPIIGGFGGGYAASKAQEALLPPSEEEAMRLQQARQDQPLPTILAETLPSLLAMKPSLATLREAGGGLRQLSTLGSKSLSAPQIGALSNVGIGATVGGIAEMAGAKLAGEDIDPTRVLGAMAANALITDPNRIGQRVFGFKPVVGSTPDAVSIDNTREIDLAKYAAPRTEPVIPERQQVYKDIADLDALYEQNAANVAKAQAIKANVEAKKMREYIEAQTKLAEEQTNAEIADIKAQAEMYRNMSKPFVGEEIVKPEVGETIGKPLAFKRPSQMVAEAKPFIGELVEPVEGLAAKAATAPVEITTEPPRGLGSEVVIEQPTAPLRVPRGGELPKGAGTQKLKTAQEMTARKGRSLYADEGTELTADQLRARGIELSGILNKDTRKVAAALSDRLGYKYQETTNKIVNPDTGKEVPGRAFVDKLIAEVNPTSPNRGPDEKGFGLDTPLHEPLHIFVEEMRANGTPFEKKLIQRGEELFGDNETLVREGGKKAVFDLYDESSPIKKYMRLLWKHIKLRFGAGSKEDVRDWLIQRMMKAPPKAMEFDAAGKVIPQTGEARTEASGVPATASEGGSQLNKPTYIGEQQRPDGSSFSLYNTPDGSTVTAETLKKLGYEVPERNVDLSSEEGQKRMAEMKKQLGVADKTVSAGDKKALATLPQQKLAEGGSELNEPDWIKKLSPKEMFHLEEAVSSAKNYDPVSMRGHIDLLPESVRDIALAKAKEDAAIYHKEIEPKLLDITPELPAGETPSQRKREFQKLSDTSYITYDENSGNVKKINKPEFQLDLWDAIRAEFAGRQAYKEAEAAWPEGGRSQGVFRKDMQQAVAPDKQTLQHEVLHKVFNNNQAKINEYITALVSKGDMRIEDIRTVARYMSAKGYTDIASNIRKQLKDSIEDFGFRSSNDLHVPTLGRGLEESLTQTLSGRHETDNYDVRPILEKVFGKRVMKFVNEGRKEPAYYPLFDEQNQRWYAEGGSDLNSAVEQRTADKTSFAPFMTSQVNKVRKLGETGNHVADKAERFLAKKSLYEGRFGERGAEIVQAAKMDKATDKLMMMYLNDIRHKGDSAITPPKELQPMLDAMRKHLVEIADYAEQKGVPIVTESGDVRAIKKNPNWIQNMLSSDVAAEWNTNPTSKKSQSYIEKLAKHIADNDKEIKKIKEPTAKFNAAYKIAQQYARAVGKSEAHDSAAFAALRRAAGVGLPWDLMEQSLERAMFRYGRRAARDIAFWEEIQSDPIARYALGVRDEFEKLTPADADIRLPSGGKAQPIDADRDVQALRRTIFGKQIQEMPRIQSAAKLVHSMIMQIPTGLRDMASIPVNSLPYMGMGEGMRYAAKALNNVVTDYKNSFSRARQSGAVRGNLNDFVMGDPDAVKSKLNSMSNFFARYGGREALEGASRTFTYALGEELAKAKFVAARNGDKAAQQLLKRLGSAVDNVEQYFGRNAQLPSADVVARVAKEFTDAVQGGYDARNLPTWAIEGSVAPFVSLQRWGIEKANVIYKDVIKPMNKGNYAPFLRYSLGAMLSGAAIEQLNELVNNARGYDPTIAEVTKSDEADAGDYAKKMVALMQMAGYAGIVSDTAKLAMAAGSGNYSKYNSPLNYPLYSYVTETLAGNLSDYVEALSLGEDPFRVTAQLVEELATQSLQNARMIRNYADASETERKQMNRDYRVWQEMSGRAGAKMTPDYNRFVGVEEREFKNATDPEKIGELAQRLFSRYLSEEDPIKMVERFESLRRMPITWMPSIDESPVDMAQFLTHLQDTQGVDASSDILGKYATQKQVNQAKKELVPQLTSQ